MFSLLNDERSDVRAVAENLLRDLLESSAEVRSGLLECITAHKIPPAAASRLIDSAKGFSESDVVRAEAILSSLDPKWRLAAMAILKPELMPIGRIIQHARRLAGDPESEIRERARRLLDTFEVSSR
jgi:hypothetical protein